MVTVFCLNGLIIRVRERNDMDKTRIIALKYGESTISEAAVFRGGNPEKRQKISFIMYLICTKGRKILVDAGCNTMEGWDMKYFCGPLPVLEQANVDPSDITDVILTHAHHDHVECVSFYQNALVHIQKEEYPECAKYIPDYAHVNLFEEEYDVCENVKAVKIGGHSIGSSIVIVNDGRDKYVITGDEIYSEDCVAKQIPTGSSVNPKNSEAFIKNYKEYKLLLCHEKNILEGKSGIFVING